MSRIRRASLIVAAGVVVACIPSCLDYPQELLAPEATASLAEQSSVVSTARPAFDRVLRFNFEGFFADAVWGIPGGVVEVFASSTIAFAGVTQVSYDADGNPTGGSTLWASSDSGFSFDIQQPLRGATLTGRLPGFACVLDANLDPVSCRNINLLVDVAWTGQGTIVRDNLSGVYKSFDPPAGSMGIQASQSSTRDASVTDDGVPVSDVWWARVGNVRGGVMSLCIGHVTLCL